MNGIISENGIRIARMAIKKCTLSEFYSELVCHVKGKRSVSMNKLTNHEAFSL